MTNQMTIARDRPVHTPSSTYRLQFHRDFTFREAEAILPYLDRLGVSDCYCSPYLMARPGSRHGYDIIDHTRLNPEVGSDEDYAAFVGALRAHGLGQLLDFVPNHMGIDPRANTWWRDVLENGPSSVYGRYFDIDWDPVKPELKGKVLLPILGDQYGMVLERGELHLGFSDGALHLDYFDHSLPINPWQATRVYEQNAGALRTELGDDNPDLREFLSILTELRNLPDYLETDAARIAERHREKEVARERLVRLVQRSPRIAEHIDRAVAAYNGEPGRPESFDLLHALLEDQPYRLAYWQTAAHEINYRRFFDINDLAGIRMEDPHVFAATHVLVERLIAEGAVCGLRIDHPDGLYDPEEYFRRLQDLASRALASSAEGAKVEGSALRPLESVGIVSGPVEGRHGEDVAAVTCEEVPWGADMTGSPQRAGDARVNHDRQNPAESEASGIGRAGSSQTSAPASETRESDARTDRTGERQAAAADDEGTVPRPLYLLAEKILSNGEELPLRWAIYGTTGYNFLNDLNGLFVDPAGGRPLRRIYRRATGQMTSFDEVVYACKKLITKTSLASELNVLAHALNRLSEGNRRSRDFTLNSLREVLGEVVACFPVYRTYISPAGWSSSDRQVIETAVRKARKRNPATESSAWDFLREVLLPRPAEGQNGTATPDGADRRVSYPPPAPQEYRDRLHFAMRFQQYTAPVQAKGVEDTAFYRYNLLVSLNEVGGNPGTFGRSPAEFHQTNRERLRRWPLEMVATATHDTKLGEDVRARIDVLSELVDDWRRALARWMRINANHRTKVDGEPAPERNDEYRFYQVLLGTWPPDQLPLPEASPALAAVQHPAPEATRRAGTERPRPTDEYVKRVRDYMTKASKEAKVRTSWINDNVAYEAAVTQFVERSLSGPASGRFFDAFFPLARRVAHLGMLNSLSQLVLKLAVPGVPDFYQGTDLWDLHLVDPDNRGAVDYAQRAGFLEQMEPWLASGDTATRVAALQGMLQCWSDGRIKLFVTTVGLRLRRERPGLFLAGEYLALEPDMAGRPGDVVSFARRAHGDTLIVVAPRLVARLVNLDLPVGTVWGEANLALPPELAGRYRDLLSGDTIQTVNDGGTVRLRLSDALRHCPVGLLMRE